MKLSAISEEVKFDYILVEDHYSSNNNIKSLKTGNFVYPIYEDSPVGNYFYADNKVQNVVELYTNGVIDIDTLYYFNGRYYGDLNADKSTNVMMLQICRCILAVLFLSKKIQYLMKTDIKFIVT